MCIRVSDSDFGPVNPGLFPASIEICRGPWMTMILTGCAARFLECDPLLYQQLMLLAVACRNFHVQTLFEEGSPCSADHAICVLHGRGNVAFGGAVQMCRRICPFTRLGSEALSGTATDNSKVSHQQHCTGLKRPHFVPPNTRVVGVALQITAISTNTVRQLGIQI